MADTAAAPRSWMLWALAVAGIGVLTGVLILVWPAADWSNPSSGRSSSAGSSCRTC